MNNLDIKKIREKLTLSQSSLASLLGVSLRTVQNWEAGENIPKTKHEILRNLLNSEGLQVNEPQTETYTKNAGDTSSENTKTKSIPLIPLDAVAGFGSGEMQIMEYDAERYIVPEFAEVHTDFMIRVKGSSMYPKYNSGDIVACRKIPVETFFQWNKVYVLDTVQGAMIKRIHKSEINGSVKCISDNEKYEPFDISLSEIYSLAIVVGVIRLE
jgi:repressor LexA